MAEYKSLAADTRWVDIDGRLTQVEPGGIVAFPDDFAGYIQTGEHGEDPLYAPVSPAKAAAKTSSKEK